MSKNQNFPFNMSDLWIKIYQTIIRQNIYLEISLHGLCSSWLFKFFCFSPWIFAKFGWDCVMFMESSMKRKFVAQNIFSLGHFYLWNSLFGHKNIKRLTECFMSVINSKSFKLMSLIFYLFKHKPRLKHVLLWRYRPALHLTVTLWL